MDLTITNDALKQALMAVPAGHRHIRLVITTREGDTVVLQEAAVAAIVRAYTSIKTHPSRRAVKLVSRTPEGLKEGYAKDQLIEEEVADEEVVAEITAYLEKGP
jgi:hypothetical protein